MSDVHTHIHRDALEIIYHATSCMVNNHHHDQTCADCPLGTDTSLIIWVYLVVLCRVAELIYSSSALIFQHHQPTLCK